MRARQPNSQTSLEGAALGSSTRTARQTDAWTLFLHMKDRRYVIAAHAYVRWDGISALDRVSETSYLIAGRKTQPASLTAHLCLPPVSFHSRRQCARASLVTVAYHHGIPMRSPRAAADPQSLSFWRTQTCNTNTATFFGAAFTEDHSTTLVSSCVICFHLVL